MFIKSLSVACFVILVTSFANPITSGHPYKTSSELPAYTIETSGSVETNIQKLDNFISGIYNELEFVVAASDLHKPSLEVFKKGLIGYYNLIKRDKIKNTDFLTIIDFTLPSDKKRLWIINLSEKRILFNDLVAHGRKSGNIVAENFSNVPESHMSSQGFYVTGNTYFGKHGLSLRLNGMEEDINHNAFDRAIVMHGADYVSEGFIKTYGRLGRSYGCPSVSNEISKDVINTIKDNTCLFIYSPVSKYDETSALLNTADAADFFSSSITM